MQDKSGDKNAQTLFKGIAKLSNPPKKNVSDAIGKPTFFVSIVQEKINEAYYTSPDILIGYELNWLMSKLSFIVEAVCTCPPTSDFLKPCRCSKLTPESKIKMRQTPLSDDSALIEKVKKVFAGNARIVSRLTLLRLATIILMKKKDADDSEAKLSEDKLNDAVQNFRAYQKENAGKKFSTLPIFGGEPLPYEFLE